MKIAVTVIITVTTKMPSDSENVSEYDDDKEET